MGEKEANSRCGRRKRDARRFGKRNPTSTGRESPRQGHKRQAERTGGGEWMSLRRAIVNCHHQRTSAALLSHRREARGCEDEMRRSFEIAYRTRGRTIEIATTIAANVVPAFITEDCDDPRAVDPKTQDATNDCTRKKRRAMRVSLKFRREIHDERK